MIVEKLKNLFLHNVDTETLANKTEVIESDFDKEMQELDKEILESENLEEEILSPGEKPDTLNNKSDELADPNKQPEKSAEEEKQVIDDKKDDKPLENNRDTLSDKPSEQDKNTLNDQNYGVITDELIKTFPEEQQVTLKRYEGKPFSEALKTIIHQKQQIGKLASRKNIDVKPENPYPDPIKQSEEADKIKDQLVENRMRSVYADYPKDEYEWNELQSSNFIKAQKYALERENVAKELSSAYQSAVHAQTNYHELNDAAIVEASSQIDDYLKSYGLDVSKDFGIDLSSEESVNNFMDSLLLSADGKQLDLNVWETWENDRNEKVLRYGVPIIKKDALLNKFQGMYNRHVMLKIKENAFLEGLAAAQSNKIAPSFSNSKTTIRKQPSKTAIPQSIEELDRMIEESENSNNY